MSDENQTTADTTDAGADTNIEMPSERDVLMTRANQLGVKYSPNIGTDTLRERVNAALNGTPEVNEAGGEEKTANQRKQETRAKMRKEELKLVRVRITNLNPSKKELYGEIFTVANKHLGIVKKYVPYGEATEDGYHIPNIIYKQLKARKFLNIKTKKDRNTGNIIVEQNMAPEFALEVLDPLTELELKQLANRQAAAKGLTV